MGFIETLLRRQPERRSASFSIADPALAEFLGISTGSTAGEGVNEATALSLSAVWRAVGLVSGIAGSLPLKTYREQEDGSRERVASIFDDPGAPLGITRMSWVETVCAHLLLHGNAYLAHLRNAAGGLAGLQPLHPRSVTVKEDLSAPGRRIYTVQMAEGPPRAMTMVDLTHIMGFSTDGIRGLSPIVALRNALGASLAADRAAGNQFRSGLLLGGVISSDEHLDETQARQVKEGFERKLGGAHHAGELLVTNAALKFSPWQQTAEDGQFIESRAMQIEEVARAWGVPKELLSASGATSWGSGIQELVRGFQKFTLAPLATRIEEALSPLLARPRFVEFDFAGLLQPNESEATDNLVKEVGAGLLTIDEARALKNRPSREPVAAAATDPEEA